MLLLHAQALEWLDGILCHVFEHEVSVDHCVQTQLVLSCGIFESTYLLHTDSKEID
jgi:hypothetical protein